MLVQGLKRRRRKHKSFKAAAYAVFTANSIAHAGAGPQAETEKTQELQSGGLRCFHCKLNRACGCRASSGDGENTRASKRRPTLFSLQTQSRMRVQGLKRRRRKHKSFKAAAYAVFTANSIAHA